MTVEHTNRTLRKLRIEFGITLDGGVVSLGDLAITRQFAEFDDRYILLRDATLSSPWLARTRS